MGGLLKDYQGPAPSTDRKPAPMPRSMAEQRKRRLRLLSDEMPQEDGAKY